ncbi:hypothetical protein [Embleya sp. NBC_00896]|uniref:hypothetical protein n=1 Tax=Embleya sp. NBC_00896 TaxID=2975961 RepID=UPI00386B8A46|nr:hypothetical protein OG928_00270 [Embleya sp. NBC_00896]
MMALRGLTPLVPYQANGQPWKSECGNCGGVTAPTLSSVIKAIGQEQPKCCDVCRRNGPINASAAEDLLRRAGAEPLEPYPGIKVRWHARCLNNKCKQEIHALLDSIKHAGTGACEACGAYGIKADDDALVYLMTHPVHGAAKIGIAKLGGKRLTQHLLCGWEMDSRVDLLGRQARAVERFVLDRWKALRLPYGVHPDDMPQAGYTETVKMAVRSLVEIRDDLARALREEC